MSPAAVKVARQLGSDRALAAALGQREVLVWNWRARCQAFADGVLDPLGQPLVMPEIREWTREERQSLEKRILRLPEHAARP